MRFTSTAWTGFGAASLVFMFSALAGCAKHDQAKAPETVAAAPAVPNAPSREVDSRAGKDEAPDTLVVSKDVVDACPALRVIARRVQQIDPDHVWLGMLIGVSKCLTDGGLQSRSVVISGATESREIVRSIMASKGAPMDRVLVRTAGPSGKIEISLVATGQVASKTP